MKFKQLFVIASLLVCSALTFAACGDDDADSGGGASGGETLVIADAYNSHAFSNTGGTWQLNIQASAKPSVTVADSWLTVTELQSTSSTVFKYQFEAPINSTTDDRTTTVVFKVGSKQETVTVTQTSSDGLVITSDKTVNIAADGGTINITLKTNGSYQITSSAEWLIVNSMRAAMADYTESITVAKNVGAARTGTISFTLNDLTESVTISQEAGNNGSSINANALQIAKQMYPGWNLGNTMEGGNNANNYKNVGISTETSWQSTKTTQEIINFVKASGFKSVRIPAAWVMGHITNESEMTIDEAWLNRVQEIVDYCITADLYVLLNDHWDGGWLENSFDKTDDATIATNSEKLKKLWTQIANKFIDYDDHLIFGGLNEPGCDNQTKTNALLKYEQAFIDAVRATGGNNAKRTLVVQGPSTDIDNTEKYFDVTKLSDPAGSNYLMVEVHFYSPPQFTGVWENNQPIWFWGKDNHVSGDSHNATWGEEDYVLAQFQKMKTKFADKGYPVILGEYGANWRSIGTNQDKHDASIKLYNKLVNKYAIECGMVPMVWDINVANQQGVDGIMTIINRAARTIFCTPAYDGIKEGVAEAAWPY